MFAILSHLTDTKDRQSMNCDWFVVIWGLKLSTLVIPIRIFARSFSLAQECAPFNLLLFVFQVQHVVECERILSNLLEKTPETHRDYNELSKVAARFKQVGWLRLTENFPRLEIGQLKLCWWPPTFCGCPFVFSSRARNFVILLFFISLP